MVQEAAQRTLTEPAAMEADEGRAASGRAAEAAGGVEKMDIEDSDKRCVSQTHVGQWLRKEVRCVGSGAT